MKRKCQRTLELIFSRPVSASLPWRDIEAPFLKLGGEISDRAGSFVATDKGDVALIRNWLDEHGVQP